MEKMCKIVGILVVDDTMFYRLLEMEILKKLDFKIGGNPILRVYLRSFLVDLCHNSLTS